jgi:hypothetical protein
MSSRIFPERTYNPPPPTPPAKHRLPPIDHYVQTNTYAASMDAVTQYWLVKLRGGATNTERAFAV